MTLDLSTLYVVAGLHMAVAGLVHLALVATGRFARWATLWGCGHLLVGGCALVAILNDQLTFGWAPNVGNPMTVMGYALITCAVVKFDRPTARLWPLLAVAGLAAVPLVVFGEPAQFAMRVAYLSVIRAGFDIVVIVIAIRMARRESLQTGWIVGILFAVTVPLFAARAWLALADQIGPRLGGPHDDLGAWLAAGQIAFIIFRAFSLPMLQAERGQKQLMDQMERDWLTGALNRAGIDRVARTLAARKVNGPVVVMMLDVDRFKALNDTQGHAAGDAALRTLADLAREALGDSGYLARWGGDEFVCILPDATIHQARVIGSGLADRFAQVMKQDVPHELAPSISIGIARDGTLGGTPGGSLGGMGSGAGGRATRSIEELIARADMAMYAAKGERRNAPQADDDAASSGVVVAFASR